MNALHPRRPWLWLGCSTAVVAATLLYGPLYRVARADDAPPSAEQIARVEALSQTFRQVARQVRPAVVQITSTAMERESSRGGGRGGGRGSINPDDLPPQLREFFKDFGGGIEVPSPAPRRGSGSGVIIDAEKGLILTNNHVVGDAGENDKSDVVLRVKLPDGRRGIKARVVGQDPKMDVALIQIDADNLKAAGLGDSSKMEVGDWVLAVGAPFGLEQTVTQGIISATGRSDRTSNLDYQDWLQTDAAINPGNSGGPLVNMRGEVIGINVAIATSGLVAGYQGVGFAIPINEIKDILSDLREGREIVRGYLGVQIQGFEAQPGIEQTYGLKENTSGVLVEDVYPRTPAAKAGLKQQDVILALNDRDVVSADNLRAVVARTKPGKTIDLKVWREGKEITIPVTIEKQPSDFFARARVPGPGGRTPNEEESAGSEETFESLGLTVEELTPELAKKYGLEDESKGQVVVTGVEPLGDAAAMGLSPGDLIVNVQGKAIKSTRALRQALTDEALEQGLRMQVKSKSGFLTLFWKLSPSKN